LPAAQGLTVDGLEFKEMKALAQYVAAKRRLRISTLVSMATIAPALVLLLDSYISPSTTSPYLYLVFLAVSIPFSILSFRANSRLTEIVNSNDVRHTVFA
jgi:EamA domain-containing membrane protein RarD